MQAHVSPLPVSMSRHLRSRCFDTIEKRSNGPMASIDRMNRANSSFARFPRSSERAKLIHRREAKMLYIFVQTRASRNVIFDRGEMEAGARGYIARRRCNRRSGITLGSDYRIRRPPFDPRPTIEDRYTRCSCGSFRKIEERGRRGGGR